MPQMPPLHRCHILHEENEELELRYRKVTRKYKKLEQEVDTLNKKLLVKESNSAKKQEPGVSKSSASAINTPKGKCKTIQANNEENLAGLTFEKLLSLHNALIKQAERETKKYSTIKTKLHTTQLENEQLKQDLLASQQELTALRLSDEERKKNQVQAKSTPKPEKRFEKKLSELKKERDDLVSENSLLKDELSDLDKGFFDEEDVKYAFQQSGKLNIQYEKALRKLCRQFDLDEQTLLPTSDHKTCKHTPMDDKPTSAPAFLTNKNMKKKQHQSAVSKSALYTSKVSAVSGSSDEEHGPVKPVRRPGGQKKRALQKKKK